jgi:hypothetical protein
MKDRMDHWVGTSNKVFMFTGEIDYWFQEIG